MKRPESPLISVVVPCFNTERYIGEAIASILAQGLDSLQIIVIDDGSTDRSVEIVHSFGDAVECQNQPNAGISKARNAGVALARGDYLAFLDADDMWTPRSLDIRLAKLREGADCVFGGVETFVSTDLTDEERARFGSVPVAMTARFAGAMVIHRRAFDRVGLFDPALMVGEMFEWVARADRAGTVTAFIDDIVLRRRLHANNTVSRLENRDSAYLRSLKRSLAHRRGAARQRGGPT